MARAGAVSPRGTSSPGSAPPGHLMRAREGACPRFVDRSPAEVVATLLDEGEYLCSERRCTGSSKGSPRRERRSQLTSRLHDSSWPRHRTRPGRGTSPGCSDPRSGRTSTSTSSSTSSAGTPDGWCRPRELRARQPAHPGELPQAGCPARDADPALRPRGPDDQQVHGPGSPTSGSPARSAVPGSATTTPSRRRTSRPSNTTPTSPDASPTSARRSTSADPSSLGTTMSIATAESRCSPRLMSITTEPVTCSPSVSALSSRRGPNTLNASCTGDPRPSLSQPRSGSIHQLRLRHRSLLTNL